MKNILCLQIKYRKNIIERNCRSPKVIKFTTFITIFKKTRKVIILSLQEINKLKLRV